MAFLRDLAHVSDEAPNPFDLQIGPDGEHAHLDDLAAPSSRRFFLQKRLGAGGFGTVYQAIDRDRHATVALKVLRRHDGPSISRFKNEFRSLAETVHENLVQLYELHAEGDTWFFTMELVQGGDALSYVRSSGRPCDVQRLRHVLRQLAAGLAFLHRSGKLHRDVKPSNVMVSPEGHVLIVDFGLVSDISDLRTAKVVCGTPAYMAPELALGFPAGTAADWYAVGVMIYEALTGRLPFRDADSSPTWPPPAPSTVANNVPDDLDQLCIELLARDPAQRPVGREVCRRLSLEGQAANGTLHVSLREERSGGGDAVFVGRAAELDELRSALKMADQGHPVAVLVQGRSGMGKSALVQRFLQEVRACAPERLVLSGRCFEQESVPYKGIDGLVDDLCRHLRERSTADIATVLPAGFQMLARLFPQLKEIPGAGAKAAIGTNDDGNDNLLLRQRAFVALRELLARSTTQVPVLVVEDLQWGDLDSTAILGTLLHGQTPLLLVISCRSEDVATNSVLSAFFATLGALESLVDVRHVDVGPLEDHDAEALSRVLLEADDRSGAILAEKTLQSLVAEARGDPFLLAELTQCDPGAGQRHPFSGSPRAPPAE
ncbi:MAG TPA: serine/threonine-protein kinase, partial [Polyangium sp.]|nr:serine/threonine-protein kinase [Polyangium sp.]